ncbi:MAG: caspase family protein [Bacteroidota bacterium]
MLYALLVGINQYQSPKIRDLRGCVNDTRKIADYLSEQFDGTLQILSLHDEQASRANIIAGFQVHLNQATEGDTAFFYFSGHGCLEESPPSFWPFQSDRKHENLVCYDSESVPDLADKEISLLLNQLSEGGAEIIVIYDCCHAGSGTRLQNEHYRRLSLVQPVRKTEDFLPGTFANLTQAIPRHAFLAASDREQLSRERELGIPAQWGGVFSYVLHKTLGRNRSHSEISYHNLIAACRLEIERMLGAGLQTPRLETYGGFDAQQPFLQSGVQAKDQIFLVKASVRGEWKLNLGLIHGLSPYKKSSFQLFSDAALLQPVTVVALEEIGLYESTVLFPAIIRPLSHQTFWARPTTKPYERLAVFGDAPFWERLDRKALEALLENQLVFTERADTAPYQLILQDETVRILDQEGQALIGNPALQLDDLSLDVLIGRLQKALIHLSLWERLRSLPQDKEKVCPVVVRMQMGEEVVPMNTDLFTISLDKEPLLYSIFLENQDEKDWYAACYYLSPYYQRQLIREVKLPLGSEPTKIDQAYFSLPAQYYESGLTEHFVIILQNTIKTLHSNVLIAI